MGIKIIVSKKNKIGYQLREIKHQTRKIINAEANKVWIDSLSDNDIQVYTKKIWEMIIEKSMSFGEFAKSIGAPSCEALFSIMKRECHIHKQAKDNSNGN